MIANKDEVKRLFVRMKKTGNNYVRCVKALRLVGVVAVLGFAVLSFAVIAPIHDGTHSASAATGTAQESTLTLTSTRSVTSVSLVVGSVDGTFATSEVNESVAFSATTNNYTGYTLVLTASGDTTTLSDGTNTFTSITSPTSASDFADTGETGKALNNKWGFIPNYYNSSVNTTNYYGAPTSSNVLPLMVTDGANGSASHSALQDDYTIGLGVRADYTNPSGIYTNATFLIQYTANPVAYTITFADDTGDSSVTNLPSALASDTTTTSVVLTNDKVPTRAGYTFAGKWCFGSTTTNGTVCDGTEYAVGDSFGLDQTTANTPTLNAMWTYGPYYVQVNFGGSAAAGVSSVVFSAAGYDSQTVSTSGDTVTLDYGVTYDMAMNLTSAEYVFGSWAINNASNGTISSTTTNPATFTPSINSAKAIITAKGKERPRVITFKANGGTGSEYTQEIDSENGGYLKGNHFIYTDKYFMGWTSVENGTTVEYNAGQYILPATDTSLYAVWGTGTNAKLYDVVASLTKGLQTNDADARMGIKSSITMNSSGVYTYNSGVFGNSSDAGSNTIYYYRGILDDDLDGTTSTYGSNGNSANWPNYVKLTGPNDTVTCWRIVRTTGSKGVKLIYNGLYGATTSGSCANATANAQYGTSAFYNSAVGHYKNIVNVGYTVNSSYSSSAATEQSYDTLFGTNANYAGNSTNSGIKNAIEGTETNPNKFYATYLNNHDTTKLEDSAGYCNDRSLGAAGVNNWTTALDGSTLITPYGTSDMPVYYFGGYVRTYTTAQLPTLNCPRGTVDLYSVSGATTGNGQLAKPVALLTVDEAVFAGSGYSANNGSAYNANSFLRSGSNFWLLSPNYRGSSGFAYGYALSSNGSPIYSDVENVYGVRPAISLTSGATISGGSGTATDPWGITW